MSAPPPNEQTRLVHISAALDVSPHNIPLVGVPTFHDNNCNRSHKEATVCEHCRWNCCQGCGSRGGQSFTGWTLLCPPCSAHSSFILPDVPDDWKSFYSGIAPQPGGGGVVVISDDEELSERDRLMEEFPYMRDTWEIPPSGDIRDYATFTLYDAEVSVAVDPKYAHEIMRVATRLDGALDKCSQTRDPIPDPFGNLVMPPPNFTLVKVIRIQNYLQRRLFRTAVEEAAIQNEKRDESERVSEMEDIAYHGTNYNAALLVTKHGALMTRCEVGAYGRGFYGALNLGIPLVYAIRNSNRFQENPAIVMGDCLVGKNSRTNAGQDIPNPGCDTGGCGNQWIHTIFDKNHFSAEYIIVFKLATEDEWDAQLKHFANASDMAHGIAPPVIVIPQTPPTTPPAAGAASGGPSPPIAAGAASGGPSPPIAAGAASGGPSPPTGMKMSRKHKKPRISPKKSKKTASPPKSPVPGSRYKPTPPTSDDSSSEDKNDKSYKPGARPRK